MENKVISVNDRLTASKFFRDIISEGMAGGLCKKDAVLRARNKTIEFTGFDLSDAMDQKYLVPDIDEDEKLMQKYCDLFLQGIGKCLDNGRRPTAKSICDRKTPLRNLEKNQVNMIIETLLFENKIKEDHSFIKTAYYPVKKESSND